jgi:hypothetical protein
MSSDYLESFPQSYSSHNMELTAYLYLVPQSQAHEKNQLE